MEKQKDNKNHEISWIELRETNSDHQILSAMIKGQHWKGFLESKEMKNGKGETRTKKKALMKPCNWEILQSMSSLKIN